jgi:hypothetical protein
MGFFNWLSNLGQPKEVRDALKEGAAEIRRAEEEERKRALSGKEYRAEMREGKKALREESKKTAQLRKESQAYFKELAKRKLPSDASSITLDDEKWFASSTKSDAEKEAELVAAIEKSGKAMRTDSLERQAVSLSKHLSTMASNIKEAEKLSFKVNQQVVAQQGEIQRLAELLVRRESLTKEMSAVIDRKLQTFDKETIKRGQQLMVQLGKLDQEIIASFQKITSMADPAAPLRKDIETILQALAPSIVDATELTKRVDDEMRFARDILVFEGNILAAMKPAMNAQKGEIEKIGIFLKKYQKEAA